MTNAQDISILVLENDYILATDIERILARSGVNILGPFSQPEMALRALERQTPSAALLDINLGSGPSFDVARKLKEKGVPFAFVTGYEAAPEEWRDVPILTKPVAQRDIDRLVGTLLQ